MKPYSYSALPLLLLLTLTPAAQPQQKPGAAQLPSAPSAGRAGNQDAPATAPVSEAALKPYESCSFPDGLQVADLQPMPPDVRDRPVQSHGTAKTVPLVAGRRVTFAYPGAEPYASVKVEELPADNYAVNRRLLLDDFDDIIASDKTVTRNTTHGATMSGFTTVGLDRNVIAGNTLGIYMLLDDHTHVAATVYLLNPPQSKFKTTVDYARGRDTFLYNYTRCIRNTQNGKLFGAGR